VVLKIGLVV